MAGTYLTQRPARAEHSTASLEEFRSPFLFYLQTERACLEQRETDPALVCEWRAPVLRACAAFTGDGGAGEQNGPLS